VAVDCTPSQTWPQPLPDVHKMLPAERCSHAPAQVCVSADRRCLPCRASLLPRYCVAGCAWAVALGHCARVLSCPVAPCSTSATRTCRIYVRHDIARYMWLLHVVLLCLRCGRLVELPPCRIVIALPARSSFRSSRLLPDMARWSRRVPTHLRCPIAQSTCHSHATTGQCTPCVAHCCALCPTAPSCCCRQGPFKFAMCGPSRVDSSRQ